jgi:glutamate N-acetyltransferase/amino-acid N-acetyltransferase
MRRHHRAITIGSIMPVRLAAPDPARIKPVRGVELGFAEAGIKKAGRRDLMLMRLAPGSRVAGVFTQNGFAAAPVQVCRLHLEAGEAIRALVVNAGNANCGTGDDGIAAALRCCEVAAHLVGCSISEVLPFSTGVILEPLPVAKIEAALPHAFASLAADRWTEAAIAIMTTDTVSKAASRTVDIDGTTITVTGIAKGVGMLQPNMATMLAYVATDACISQMSLQAMVRAVADVSFNRVTVDGDTSTNDSFVLIATGRAANAEIVAGQPARFAALRAAIVEVAQELAQAIARDGEGATKFITITVAGAATDDEALRVGRSIGNSPLVKTALFASDPNLGRLLMAIGNARIENLETARVELWLSAGDDAVRVIEAGRRAPSYREEDGARVMKSDEIGIRVELGRGDATTVVWTCDFSYDYVKINAEYRT